MWFFDFTRLSYYVIAMQMRLKFWSHFENNTLEDCRIWKFISNGSILYVHLISEHCRMWVFNFVRTPKNVIMQTDIKLYK